MKIVDIEANHKVNINMYGNESVIILDFDSYEQTGRYICYNSEHNASVYILVDGGKELLLDMVFKFIQLYPGQSGIIPCLPTVSSANVTLWKVRGKSQEAVPLKFDPTMGFIVKNPTDYFQKAFICIARYQGRESKMNMDLDTIKETESIPQVYINDNDAKHVTVGSSFELECIIQTELHALIKVNWAHPEIDARRIVHKDLPPMKSYNYQNVTKKLQILNARKSDEGVYQCNATDHSNKENYAEVYVKVYEIPQKPKVKFDSEHVEIIKNRNETVELIAHYDVIPPSTDIRAFWTKDKEPIAPGLKKYFAKTAEFTFSLEISNLSWKDSGLYVVTVNAPGGMSEMSFLLRVRDKPVVNFQTNASCCYSSGENYTIICEVFGYPSPTVNWSWRPYCLNDVSECNSSADSVTQKSSKVAINSSTLKVKNNTDIILSYLSVVAEESGFYKCVGENSFGITSKEVIFIVSDVVDGFEIECKNAFPVVNTYFSAVCKVSSVLYNDLYWKWIPVYSNESIIIGSGIPGYSNTSKSVSLLLELEEISKNQSGTYVCVAKLRSTGSEEEKSVYVEVRDEAAALEGGQSRTESSTFLIASCIGFTFLIMVLVYVIILFARKRNRMTIIHDFDQELFQKGRMALFDPNLPLEDQVDLLPYDDAWEFPKEKLKLGRTVGQGAFGRVVKAEAFGINDFESSTVVAVKMLKERSDSNQQKALMDELKILIHLGHHVNIVNLMGAVTKNIPKGELMVIVEYCRYGNIRHYLHRYRDTFIDEIDQATGKIVPVSHPFKGESFCRSSTSSSCSVFAVDNPSYRETRRESIINCNPRGSSTGQTMVYSTSGSSGSSSIFRHYYRTDSQEHVITTSDLLCYAFQCARGMEYLTSRKLIHRDLAARNVLLADDKIVKICDFGLAKDCYKYSNYIKKGDGPLPIKWMSIESIWDHVFTTKSDVWSFGILLWEFFTLGGNPYPGIEIDEEFYKKLKAGYRMEKPELCPNFVYQIMRDCWNKEPDDRPHFYQLSDMLGNFLEDGVKQHYIDLNASYMEMNRKLKAPDYSNVKEMECEEVKTVYANVEVTNDTSAYDVPLSNKSISNAQVPNDPMEVIPMIHLETISEASNEANMASNTSEMLQVINTNKTDYLQMGKSLHVSPNMQNLDLAV